MSFISKSEDVVTICHISPESGNVCNKLTMTAGDKVSEGLKTWKSEALLCQVSWKAPENIGQCNNMSMCREKQMV